MITSSNISSQREKTFKNKMRFVINSMCNLIYSCLAYLQSMMFKTVEKKHDKNNTYLYNLDNLSKPKPVMLKRSLSDDDIVRKKIKF